MSRKCYILAGGGTGGHLYPGLAIADEITREERDALVVFACSNRPIDARILSGTPYSFFAQPVLPIRKSPLEWPAVLNAWIKSVRLAQKVMRDLQPAAVLGLGGFAAGAMCKVAAARGIPTAMINPDAVPGKANKFLAAKVDRIFTQFAETKKYFPQRLHDRVIAAGCPVRAVLNHADRNEALKFFSLDPQKKTLLVFGGSALAETIISALTESAKDLAEFSGRWQLLVPAGKMQSEKLRSALDSAGVSYASPEYINRMELGYAAADLVLCRGGAVTVAELTAVGKPAVILPYPYHRDRQQYLNAQPLCNAGAAVCIDDRIDPAANREQFRETLFALMASDEKLEEMHSHAVKRINHGAAVRIARWLLNPSAD